MSLIVDRRDLDFVLFEMLGADRLANHERFADYDREAMTQMLDAAETLAEEIFLPIAAQVDDDEPRFVDGKVEQPAVVGEALQAMAEAGFFGLSFDESLGGMQAPWTLYTAAMGMLLAANTPVTNYALLTIGAANLLNAFGSPELKARYLPPLIEGRWFGTMCLTEEQAGSSLGDLRTKATPNDDGTWSLSGSKMWITGGDQAISENIVHMVLARVPDAPAGSRGISLFLVPKMRSDEDGTITGSNHVTLAGLNHKMGQRASANCVLNFGESGETLGWMIGEPNRGLQYAFHMMNEARIDVGHSATMAGLAGYLFSADYARTRPQGRPLGKPDPSTPQVPIVEHADVRRMLLAQKAAVEGAQALCLYGAVMVDGLALATDPAERDSTAALLALLNPVVKSWPSEYCLEANKWAMQVLGGYGYSRDYPLERLYRDNRLNHIHEGTLGIQAMDLLGRKIRADGGRALGDLVTRIRGTLDSAGRHAELAEFRSRMEEALEALDRATQALLGCDDPERMMANATIFLDAFGHVVIGWMWLWQADLAEERLAEPGLGETDRLFYLGKRHACRYFCLHELPLAITRFALCESLESPALDCAPELFGS